MAHMSGAGMGTGVGIMMGVWQAMLLRARLGNTSWWIVASVAG